MHEDDGGVGGGGDGEGRRKKKRVKGGKEEGSCEQLLDIRRGSNRMMMR